MRQLVVRMSDGWRRRLADDQEPFKALVVLLIALLTLLTATLAGLQVDASARGAIAGRTADVIEANAAGRSTGSLIQTNSDLGVYRRWLELRFDTVWAQRAAEADIAVPGDAIDPRLARELLRIDRDLADWARRQSPLLQPPYTLDTQSGIDIASLDAERNVGPNARDEHERRIAATEAGVWGRKAADYVTAITIVAVGLFFLGLAVALRGPARRILATSGLAFGLVALGAGIAIASRPLDRIPPAAVDALVDAEMALARVAWTAAAGQVDETASRHWEAAVAAADRAVEIAPGYPASWLIRADARLRWADSLMLAPQPSLDAAARLLDQALPDFRHFLAIDDSSSAAWWGYGWAAYLAGDAPTAIAAADRALALAPDQFSLVLNRGLARLTAGDMQGFRTDLDTALAVAASAKLDSNGWFFGRNDRDIGRLIALRPDEAPGLAEAQRRIREAAVSARIGRPIVPGGAGAIELVTVRSLALGEDARLAEQGTVPAGGVIASRDVAGFRLVLAGRDVPAGAMISVRAWENGLESPEYRVDRQWPAAAPQMVIDLVSPYGRMGQAVDEADYEVAVFIDGATRAARTFRVGVPTLTMRASAFIESLAGSGHTCGAPQAAAGGQKATTCVMTGLTRDSGPEVVVAADASDEIRQLVLTVPRSLPIADSVLRQTAGAWFSVLLDGANRDQARQWIATAQPGTSGTFGAAAVSLAATSGEAGRLTLTITTQ